MKRYPVAGEKVVVVTGASTGIGRATARMLKGRGWRVFPTARSRTDLDLLRGEGFQPVELDLTDPDSVEYAAKEVLELSQGMLGAVVNNAGYGQPGALEDLSRSALRKQFEANVIRDAGFHEPVHSGLPRAEKRADRAGEFGGGAGGDSADGGVLREQVRAGGDRRRVADGAGAGGHLGLAGGAGADPDELPQAGGERGDAGAGDAELGVCGAVCEGTERAGADLFAADGHFPQAAGGGGEEDRACAGVGVSAGAVSGDGGGVVRGIRGAVFPGAVQGLDAGARS
jgi:hypothetical protein